MSPESQSRELALAHSNSKLMEANSTPVSVQPRPQIPALQLFIGPYLILILAQAVPFVSRLHYRRLALAFAAASVAAGLLATGIVLPLAYRLLRKKAQLTPLETWQSLYVLMPLLLLYAAMFAYNVWRARQ
jgi:hypothetical protein